MNKKLVAAALLGLFSSAAHAARTDVELRNNFTDYSKGFGNRRETSFGSTFDLGATAFTFTGTQGRRKFGGESFSAVRGAATVYHDWSDRLHTRTSIGLSENKPVFAARELSHDFNYKLRDNLVATVGGRVARYAGGRDVRSVSAGGTYYFGGGFVTYRYSRYDTDRLGTSNGHMATFRLKDSGGRGSTQLWLGAGTSLHDQEASLAGTRGKFRSLTLQRVQPIAGPLALSLSLGRTQYDLANAKYHGTSAMLGLSFSRARR